MAIYIDVKNPQRLLDALLENIENKRILTWCVDEDGDFTHVSQWNNKAWMRPCVQKNKIAFGLIGRRDEHMTKSIYGVYHGRFAEMLLTHFDTIMDSIEITSKGDPEIDSFK